LKRVPRRKVTDGKILANDELKSLGIHLGNLRKKRKGPSQGEIAKSLGYHVQFVSNWERGVSGPPIGKLAEIVDLYGMDKNEVLEFLLEHLEKNLKRFFKGL
jgi:transcriptional regulator with XRE-family HTH domain